MAAPGPSFPSGWRVPLREWTNAFVNRLVDDYSAAFAGVSDALLYLLGGLERALLAVPWWLVTVALAALVWNATRRPLAGAFVVVGLVLVGSFGLWPETVTTLALMALATALCVLVGVPLGVLMSRSARFKAVLRPVLDLMQTLPSFVYLVPVVMFFGLGNVAALFATFVYAVPPVIRLTDLGLRSVDRSLIEAAETAGASELQVLRYVRLPLALPTLAAGVNQTIMLALSMVVLTSMIGARGLGQVVLRGLQRGDVGLGLEAGLAIVLLAVVMDRVTAGYARRWDDGAAERG
ncbi:MAG TPA: ABC transporter permease subunit [Trueperaceae bacterium]|nr:ABC transporter permease subunit [Trueperaceae bacterium]